jgi:hypothetical protein
MCTYLTQTAKIRGSGLGSDGWFPLRTAVVYFDHPQNAPVEHALCIDFRGAGLSRVAVELDASSARSLAETILANLDSTEARALAPRAAPG